MNAGCADVAQIERPENRRDRIVYGEEDRQEAVFSELPRARELGRSSAALVPASQLDFSDPEHVAFDAPSLQDALGVCADEPFAAQPVLSTCSGTLIAPDLLLTAGHCVTPSSCADLRVIFAYAVDASGSLAPLDATQVAACSELIVRERLGSLDYAILRLDRVMLDRVPVPVRVGDAALAPSTALFTIGHPTGLPQKVAGGATARDVRADVRDYFTANLDAFPGNSGGGVFALSTGELVGHVARGPDGGYVRDPVAGCYRAQRVADGHPVAIESTYVARALEALCAVSPEPALCACGDGACDASRRETSASCPVDCGSQCGDGACNGGETGADCYADCGACGNARCEPYEVAHLSCCEDCGCPGGHACSEDVCSPRVGNVDGDADLDRDDVAVLSELLNRRGPAPLLRRADVDCDGAVTATDRDLLQQSLAPGSANLPCERVSEVAIGLRHSCGLWGGEVRCWGDDSSGQLGTSARPVSASARDSAPVRLPRSIRHIAAGSLHTCALDGLGRVFCWGSNQFGQSGPAQRSDRPEPVELAEPATQIGAGASHTCALLASQRVQCWGDNQFGQLGSGIAGLPASSEPIAVRLPEGVEQIAVGASHTCALLRGGEVRCWGYNQFGQLGLGNRSNVGDDETPDSLPPAALGGPARSLRAHWMQSCAFRDHDVVCWGDNSFAQLGYHARGFVGDDETPASMGPVPLGDGVRDLALGQAHSCALYHEGGVRCWGLGSSGQLGYGTPSLPPPPPGVPAPPGPPGPPNPVPSALAFVNVGSVSTAIYAGSQGTCAGGADGAIRCWGANQFGQLGHAHRSNLGDDETPESAGTVPTAEEPNYGWQFTNPHKLDVSVRVENWRSRGTNLAVFLAHRGKQALSSFRVLYALSGGERPGVPIELEDRATPWSVPSLRREARGDLYSLELEFGHARSRRDPVTSRAHFGVEQVRLAFEHGTGWDAQNDYSATALPECASLQPTTRLQVLGPLDEVIHGWTRPPTP